MMASEGGKVVDMGPCLREISETPLDVVLEVYNEHTLFTIETLVHILTIMSIGVANYFLITIFFPLDNPTENR